MTFRALKPFRLTRDGRSKIIAAGQVFDLDPDAGQRLLAKASGLVTTVLQPVEVGEVVTWRSPLFGRMQGALLLIEGDNLLVEHPTIGQPAWICRTWLLAKGEQS